MITYMSGEPPQWSHLIVTTARGGNGGPTGDWEFGLGPEPNVFPLIGQMVWTNGVPVPFSVVWNGSTATYTVDGRPPLVLTPSVGIKPPRAVRLGARTTVANGSMAYTGLTLTTPAGTQSLANVASGAPNTWNGVWFTLPAPVTTFAVTGSIVMAWIGSIPTGSKIPGDLKLGTALGGDGGDSMADSADHRWRRRMPVRLPLLLARSILGRAGVSWESLPSSLRRLIAPPGPSWLAGLKKIEEAKSHQLSKSENKNSHVVH